MSEAKDFYKEAGNEKKAALFSKAIGVGQEQAKVIYLDLFLYTHGMAVLTATNKLALSRTSAETMLKNFLSAFIKQENPDWNPAI